MFLKQMRGKNLTKRTETAPEVQYAVGRLYHHHQQHDDDIINKNQPETTTAERFHLDTIQPPITHWTCRPVLELTN